MSDRTISMPYEVYKSDLYDAKFQGKIDGQEETQNRLAPIVEAAKRITARQRVTSSGWNWLVEDDDAIETLRHELLEALKAAGEVA